MVYMDLFCHFLVDSKRGGLNINDKELQKEGVQNDLFIYKNKQP